MVNLLTTKIVGGTDQQMSETQQPQLLRPALEEPQQRKKVQEEESANRSAEESPEATKHNQDNKTNAVDQQRDTLTAPTPHTREGAYDMLHLWR